MKMLNLHLVGLSGSLEYFTWKKNQKYNEIFVKIGRDWDKFVAFEEKRFEKRKNVVDTMAADLCASEWSSWNCLDRLAPAEEEKREEALRVLL